MSNMIINCFLASSDFKYIDLIYTTSSWRKKNIFIWLCKLSEFVAFPKKNSSPERTHHSKNQSKFLLLWKALSMRKQEVIVETVLQLQL